MTPRSKQPETDDSSDYGGRIPPQDIDAERSLLGAIMIDNDVFPEILESVKATDFYDKRHKTIYSAMTTLYNKQQSIDLMTVTSELRSEKLLKDIGGTPYLAELTNVVPTAAHAGSYAQIVEQKSIRRRLIRAGTDIINESYESNAEVSDLLGHAEKTLFAVSGNTTKTEYSALEDLLVDAFNRMETLHNNKGSLRGLKTGFPDLDKITAGFQPGDLIILGGRPGMGKTAFATNLATNVAEINKRGVLFFSMEMSKNELVDRMISSSSGIDNWHIRTGNISDEQFATIGDTLGEMSEIPLYIDDTSSMTVLELRNKARRAAHDHNIGLIVIDYLQLINGSDRYKGNRVQEVTEISRSLKTLARELEVPVIALAQLSRSLKDRDDPRPQLTDLRESGSIEQDADLVMFVHRTDYYHLNDPDYQFTNIAEIILSKHRHGAQGTVELYFDNKRTRFLSLDKEH